LTAFPSVVNRPCGVAMTPASINTGRSNVSCSNNTAAQVMRLRTRGALLVLLFAYACGGALAQSLPPPPSGPSASPSAIAAPPPSEPQSPTALPPQPPPSAAAAMPQAPAEKRGFFDDLARWWNNSVTAFNAKLKEQQSKLDDFNKKSAEAAKDAATATQQAMKNAADAMVKSATSKVIEIHAPCAIAGN